MTKKTLPLLLVVSALATWTSLPAHAQEIARLYAPQAPAGSSYVRVINATDKAVNIEFARKTNKLDTSKIATDYRVVSAASALSIKVNGETLSPVKITPDSFTTLIIDQNLQVRAMIDTTDNRNDLKAELRFYNIAAACNASLSIENGAVIFDQTPYGDSKKRTINPVKANVVGHCDATASKAAALPALKSGDRTSIFLTGDSQHPRLVVQLDATEPYSGTR